MHELVIRHEGGAGFRFVVQRLTGGFKTADPVELADPLVRRLGDTELRFGAELAWYLESYLSYPFGPNAERAERVLEALRAWGTEAFETLFGSGDARDFYRDASREGREDLQLLIVSDTPAVLAWSTMRARTSAGQARGSTSLSRIHAPKAAA